MLRNPTDKLFALVGAFALIGAVVIAGAVVAGQLTAANDLHDVDQDTSFLRVAHSSPNAGAVDVYVDNESVLTDVPFGTLSDYLALSQGAHQIAITEAGDPEAALFEGDIQVEPRTAITLAATGEVGSVVGGTATQTFEATTYRDNAFRPDENESAIRIIHLSPDAPSVDITVQSSGVVLADNISFREGSEYVNVPAGNHTVEIREESPTNDGTTITTVDLTLENGSVYSALALGYLDPPDDSNPAFEVNLAEDAAVTIFLPVEEAPPTETPPNETATPPTETPPNETVTPPTETETPTTATPAL